VALALSAFAPACGDDAEEFSSACTFGFSLLAEMHNALQESAPSCQSDADCMFVGDGVACGGSSVGGCGTVIHRAQLEQYQDAQEELRDRFCAAVMRSKYGCSAGPSCIAFRPACDAGRCVGKASSFSAP
jgi:hypothetical protein